MTAELLKVHEVQFEPWRRCTASLRAFDDGSALFEVYDRDYLHGELERVDYYRFEPASVQALAVELMKLVSAAGASFVHTTDPWP